MRAGKGCDFAAEIAGGPLDALAQGSDKLPYLPPAALTRESFYQDHD